MLKLKLPSLFTDWGSKQMAILSEISVCQKAKSPQSWDGNNTGGTRIRLKSLYPIVLRDQIGSDGNRKYNCMLSTYW